MRRRQRMVWLRGPKNNNMTEGQKMKRRCPKLGSLSRENGWWAAFVWHFSSLINQSKSFTTQVSTDPVTHTHSHAGGRCYHVSHHLLIRSNNHSYAHLHTDGAANRSGILPKVHLAAVTEDRNTDSLNSGLCLLMFAVCSGRISVLLKYLYIILYFW